MYEKQINRAFQKMNCKALNYSRMEKSNEALDMVAYASKFMTKANMTCYAPDLEKVLSNEAKKIQKSMCLSDEKTILFFDSAGINLRGLSAAYLKALIILEYKITYVTNKTQKGKIPDIESLLNNGKNHILFVDFCNSLDTVLLLQKHIMEKSVSKILCYGYAFDVIGPVLSNSLEKVTSFYISSGDHTYWAGSSLFDYIIEYRDYGASTTHFLRSVEKAKILKQPFYPLITDMEFQGFPFERKHNKVIFSGGELYKTFGEHNVYYKLMEQILSNNGNVIFYYAGRGDVSQLEYLKNKFPNRVYWSDERKDFFQVIQNSDIYISTHPIVGGQMLQYAAIANTPPLTLWHDQCADGFLLEEKRADIFFYSEEEIMIKINSLLSLNDIKQEYERKLAHQVIQPEEFEKNLFFILQNQQSSYYINYEPVDIEVLQKTYQRRRTRNEYYRLYIPCYNYGMAVRNFPVCTLVSFFLVLKEKIKTCLHKVLRISRGRKC